MVELSVVEQKYQAVLAVIAEGREVTDVARQFGVSRQTLHAWLSRYEADGLAGLVPRSRRPGSCPHQMDPSVEVLVLELRRTHPHWGPRRLLHELARRSVSPMPSRSGVYRALVRAGVIEVEPRRSRREHWHRWERGSPMELWQLDLVGGFLLADGSHAKALTGVDDHSRFCVSAALMPHERTGPVCDAFAAALRTHGIPQQVLTDNGRVFTGRFNHPPVEVLFDRICRENGIDHLLTAPRSPTTTGKIERFHRSLRAEFLTGRMFPTLARAQAELDAWVRGYNHDRPHQSLDMATPASRFLLPDRQDQRTEPVLEALARDRTGDDWVSRLVAANGVISVAWQQISAGIHRAGHRVDVHVADHVLQIWDGAELLKTVERTTRGEVRKKNAQKQHA
ncbi:IS481 family transposase [Intrasporangium mesophilum]